MVAPQWFASMEDRSLALDAAGFPHIAYGCDFLYYAWFDGTAISDGAAWHTETVDDAGGVGCFADLGIDAAGRPHISYYDDTNMRLKYACRVGAPYNVYLAVVTKGP